MKTYNITESDLEAIFASRRLPKRRKPLGRILYATSIFGLVLIIVFVVINANSLTKNISYWYHTEYKNDVPAAQVLPQKYIMVSQNEEIGDNRLKISALSIDAPISWKINNEPSEVQQALQNSVIHLSGTALPGEKGNVFITGHSSDLPWLKGNYKTVFSLLNKLVSGDQIKIKYQDEIFVYSVYDSKVVSADDISVLKQDGESKLTLMTCTPVGTSLRRLIVLAKQIHPNPNTNTEQQSSSAQSTKLPKPR